MLKEWLQQPLFLSAILGAFLAMRCALLASTQRRAVEARLFGLFVVGKTLPALTTAGLTLSGFHRAGEVDRNLLVVQHGNLTVHLHLKAHMIEGVLVDQ